LIYINNLFLLFSACFWGTILKTGLWKPLSFGPERKSSGPNAYVEIVMGRNIYVGNLSFNVSGEELEGMFTEFGEVVSANVITDRETGRSRGFGFVEMAEESAAEAAINGLNGKDFGGRALTVNEAKPRENRGGGGGGGHRGGGGGGGRRY
jgi:RNA recognition motif-containing protein